MKNIIKQILVLIVLIGFLVLPYFVFAQSPLDRMKNVATEGGFAEAKETTLSEVLGVAVNAFLSLLGVIFIILMLIGGYHWMTAAGSQEKVDKAINTIRRAIIGLIIVVGSYAIWNFILVNFILK